MRRIEKPVLCFGDTHPDIVIDKRQRLTVEEATEKLLKGEQIDKTRNSEIKMVGGGTVGNVATTLGRLGEKTLFMGKVGNDCYGEFAKKNLEFEGVDTKWLLVKTGTFTEIVICLIDGEGDRDFFMYPDTGSAFMSMMPKEICDDIFSDFGMAYVSGTGLLEEPVSTTIRGFMKACRRKGIPVAFDLNLRTNIYGWDQSQKDKFTEAIEHSDIVFGSGKEELAILEGTQDVNIAVKMLVEKGKIVVSKAGAKGASVYTEKEAYQMPALPVHKVDTVGAGDTFNGGFLAAYARGESIRDCLLWGSAAAGYSLQLAGGGNGPNEQQLHEIIRLHGKTVRETKRLYP